jgi:hypothetical protein
LQKIGRGRTASVPAALGLRLGLFWIGGGLPGRVGCPTPPYLGRRRAQPEPPTSPLITSPTGSQRSPLKRCICICSIG